MATPSGLSTANLSSPRGPSRHSRSTSVSPWSLSMGWTISSIRAIRSSSCIGAPQSKKVGNAHFFGTLARAGARGKLPYEPRKPTRPGGRRLYRRLQRSGRGGRGVFRSSQRIDGGDDGVLGHPRFVSGATRAHLDHALLGQRVADGDAYGEPKQIGVLE